MVVVSSATSEATPVAVRGRGRKNVHHLGADDRSSTRVRIVDATLRCLARQGLAKTTIDDIAREAKLSRATLYRTFPGGKDAIVAAVVETEVARLFSSLAVVMGEAADLEDVLVAGMVGRRPPTGRAPCLGVSAGARARGDPAPSDLRRPGPGPLRRRGLRGAVLRPLALAR